MAADEGKILRAVLTEMAKEGFRYVPVGISARHVHLCPLNLKKLFGEGYELHPYKDLSQPGQFASQEKVTIEGPKGRIENVRVLGPVRKVTQVEISLTDAMVLGLKDIPVRMSGNIGSTPGIRIIGPAGSIDLPAGVIAAARHLHISSEQARAFRLHDGDVVALRVPGDRPCIMENVAVRAGDGHELELHLDTDEANACNLRNGDFLEIIEPGNTGCRHDDGKAPDTQKISARAAALLSGMAVDDEDSGNCRILDLVTESDINNAQRTKVTCVYCDRKALITPAARDRAMQLGIDIIRAESPEARKTLPAVSADEVLELVTATDLDVAFRDNKTQIYCTAKALITPAAKERIAETRIRVIRI